MRLLLVCVLGVWTANIALAQDKANFPTTQEVNALLHKEPLTEASWPTWRQRLLDWMGDLSQRTKPATQAAEKFLNGLADDGGRLPPRYGKDYLAWYFLGGSYVYQQPPRGDGLFLAELAYRHSIAIEPKFARSHRNLAMVLVFQTEKRLPVNDSVNPRLEEAERELQEAIRLDPSLPLFGIDALLAQRRGQLARAAGLFEKALEHDPKNVELAVHIAECTVFDEKAKAPSTRILPLVEQFPHDGKLAALYAFSLALDRKPREAYEELQRARSLGVDPTKILLSSQIVKQIEQEGQPSPLEPLLKIVLAIIVLGAAVLLIIGLWKKYVRR